MIEAAPATSAGTVSWVGVAQERSALCRAVLDDLPQWFGDPAAKARYIAEAADAPTLAAHAGATPAGILTLRRHFPQTFEMRILGVRPAHQGIGHGRRLVEAAAAHARDAGAGFLTVKTLGPSNRDPHYAKTRAFYAALGFHPLEEFATFWRDPPNPCLFLVRPLP